MDCKSRNRNVVAQFALLSVAVAMVVGGGEICGRQLVGGGRFEVFAAKKSLSELLENLSEVVGEVEAAELEAQLDLIVRGGTLQISKVGFDRGLCVVGSDFTDDRFVDYCLSVGRVLDLPPPMV